MVSPFILGFILGHTIFMPSTTRRKAPLTFGPRENESTVPTWNAQNTRRTANKACREFGNRILTISAPQQHTTRSNKPALLIKTAKGLGVGRRYAVNSSVIASKNSQYHHPFHHSIGTASKHPTARNM